MAKLCSLLSISKLDLEGAEFHCSNFQLCSLKQNFIMPLDLPHTQTPSKQVLILIDICGVVEHSEVHLSEPQAFDVAIQASKGNEQNQRLPRCTSSPSEWTSHTRPFQLLFFLYQGSYLSQNCV